MGPKFEDEDENEDEDDVPITLSHTPYRIPLGQVNVPLLAFALTHE
jgi:hypothetical protein